MMLLNQFTICALDGLCICVAVNAESIVIVFLFGALQQHLCFLEQRLQFWRLRMVFIGLPQSTDSTLEVVVIQLVFRLPEKSIDRMWLQFQDLLAVLLRSSFQIRLLDLRLVN